MPLELVERPEHRPVFHRDASAMSAVFPARHAALRRLVPDRRFRPAHLAPGVGAVAITAIEHRDREGAPSDELGISVLLCPPGGADFPGRVLSDGLRHPERTHAFVLDRQEQGVAFGDGPGLARRATLTDGADHVLTLEGADVPAVGTAHSDRFRHVLLDGRPQAAQVAMHKHATGATWRLGAARLSLGSGHPTAELLAGLLLSRSSVFWEWTPSVEAIVFDPEHLDLPRLRRPVEGRASSVPTAA